MNTSQQPAYFRKIATVLIRVIAIGLIVRGLCVALYYLGWWSEGWQGWSVAVFDLIGGAALWVFSPRLAGLVARGLDDSA